MSIFNPISLQVPYNYQAKQYRCLWHQTLDTIIRYPELPERNINFDQYPIFKVKKTNQRTLGGDVVTIQPRFIEDAIVEEVWSADDLSINAGFFYELVRFLNHPLNLNDNVIWYPADRTDKAFIVEMLDVIIGDTSQMRVDPIHGRQDRNYRWLRDEARIILKINSFSSIPDGQAIFEGS